MKCAVIYAPVMASIHVISLICTVYQSVWSVWYFDNFFVLNRMKHNYDTRLASKCSYALPLVRTNLKFGIILMRR
jgi:hypothetical protein